MQLTEQEVEAFEREHQKMVDEELEIANGKRDPRKTAYQQTLDDIVASQRETEQARTIARRASGTIQPAIETYQAHRRTQALQKRADQLKPGTAFQTWRPGIR